MPIRTYTIDQSPGSDGWLKSAWPAGQSALCDWDPSSVEPNGHGGVDLILRKNPAFGTGSARRFSAGEVQGVGSTKAVTGRWGWVSKAPKMVPGAIYGLFCYQSDWQKPWIEYDFEWVGANTNQVQIAVHMKASDGIYRHVTKMMPLPFDAAAEFHLYEVEVKTDGAVFFVDGKVLLTVTKGEMGGRWDQGELVSYADLWMTDNVGWAGQWTESGLPIRGSISDAGLNRTLALPGATPAPTPTPVPEPTPTPVPTPVPTPAPAPAETVTITWTGSAAKAQAVLAALAQGA